MRFIIPFGPGAGADIGARLIQEKLSARWGKPVVIDNRPGGDSIIAIQAVLSANDDHTFLWGPSGNFIVHPYLYQKLPYNPDDILPIASFSATVLSVGVPASMDSRRSRRLRQARARGDRQVQFGRCCRASPSSHSTTSRSRRGLTFTKVPYRDIVQAVNDLAEGRLQVYSSSYAIQRPQREAGRIKVLAQMGRKRAPSLPDIPTGAEAGFPALEMEGLVGLFGSPAVSAELREKIGADIVAVADDKEIDAKLNATAQTPTRGGAKEFTEIMLAPTRPDRHDRQGARSQADAVMAA